MIKYIEKDVVKAGIALAENKETMLMFIDNLETIDIVHCKDCKHYVSDGGAIMECEIYEVPTEDNHYCGYGERIGNE